MHNLGFQQKTILALVQYQSIKGISFFFASTNTVPISINTKKGKMFFDTKLPIYPSTIRDATCSIQNKFTYSYFNNNQEQTTSLERKTNDYFSLLSQSNKQFPSFSMQAPFFSRMWFPSYEIDVFLLIFLLIKHVGYLKNFYGSVSPGMIFALGWWAMRHNHVQTFSSSWNFLTRPCVFFAPREARWHTGGNCLCALCA